MRKYLLFIGLASTTCFLQAQIVNIPDANFKTALMTHVPKIDLNGDKNIQLSEAMVVKNLNVSYKAISNLSGIEAFTTLTNLDCSRNNCRLLTDR